MPIKAVFLAGQTDITVNGLHQWDYGQQLEIHASDLPALIEVHFACVGMSDAVVRACSGTLGVYRATIPDVCLEQTSPIIAWIYCIDEDGTAGATVKTITLPIIARTRPQANATVPEIISDKYTELISAINAEVETLKNGEVVVAQARQADTALEAQGALHAYEADEATHADEADKASALELPAGFVEHQYGDALDSGLYMMRFSIYEREDFLKTFQAVVGVFAVTNASYIYLGQVESGIIQGDCVAYVKDNVVSVYLRDGSEWVEISTTQGHWCTVMYKKICS